MKPCEKVKVVYDTLEKCKPSVEDWIIKNKQMALEYLAGQIIRNLYQAEKKEQLEIKEYESPVIKNAIGQLEIKE